MTTIKESKNNKELFYVNGKGVFIDEWLNNKYDGFLTTKEKKDFSNYLKAVKGDE